MASAEQAPDVARLVLDDGFSRGNFSTLCYKRNWELKAIIDRDPNRRQPNQVVCRDPETGVRIAYSEDYLLDIRYILLEGPMKHVQRLEAELYAAPDVKVIGKERIRRAITGPGPVEELVLGLRWLAAVSTKAFDQNYFSLFKMGLEHEDPAVRHAAVQVVSYPAWEELKRLVEQMREQDPDPGVREAARTYIEASALLEQGKGKGSNQAAGAKKSPKRASRRRR